MIISAQFQVHFKSVVSLRIGKKKKGQQKLKDEYCL